MNLIQSDRLNGIRDPPSTPPTVTTEVVASFTAAWWEVCNHIVGQHGRCRYCWRQRPPARSASFYCCETAFTGKENSYRSQWADSNFRIMWVIVISAYYTIQSHKSFVLNQTKLSWLFYPLRIPTVKRNKVKYAQFIRKRMNTNPKRGPFHFRSPARMFWRTVSKSFKLEIFYKPMLCGWLQSFHHVMS